MVLIGKLKTTSSVKSSGNFQQNVIKIVKQIPFGRVTTYGTVAVMAGVPRGARLVGGVLRFNSQKHDLPWQRVIDRHGFISIKGEFNIKEIQKSLLEQEGVEVSDDFMVDLEKYGWPASAKEASAGKWGEEV